MRSRSRNALAFVAAVMVLALATVPVLASSTTWKLYSFNTSGRSLRSQTVPMASNGSASFTFPKTPDASYLLSTAAPSIGGGSLSATAGITDTGTGTTYAYYPSPSSPAMVGLYFETKAAGAFNPSDYWWSGSSRVSLETLVGTSARLSTALDGANWTNYYGKPGNQAGTYVVNGVTYPSAADGFAAAVARISSWGVSFGGGSFYANGVGTPTGSAVFTLTP